MVRVDIFIGSAHLAILLKQVSVTDGIANHVFCFVFCWICLSVFLLIILMQAIPSLSVVLPVIVSLYCPVLPDVFLVALLALVDMTVSHHLVLIELSQRLYFLTLEAWFHVVSPV